MCFFRFDYYSTCRHQQTILLDFCDKATPFAQANLGFAPPQSANGKYDREPVPEQEGKGGCGSGGEAVATAGSGIGSNVDEFIFQPPSFNSLLSPFNISAITAEPLQEGSGTLLQQQTSHPLHDHHTDIPDPTGDMAGLPIFNGTSFKDLFTGSATVQPSSYEKEACSEPTSHQHDRGLTRIEYTAPRCVATTVQIAPAWDPRVYRRELDDILQHLSESYMNQDIQHVGITDSEELDNLVAEIDQLKEEVSRMREGQGSVQTTPPHEQPQRIAASIRSKLPLPTEQTVMSAAARLQKLHEAAEEKAKLAEASQPTSPPPPSPFDFPSLGTPSTPSKVSTPTEVRKSSSYATAASGGTPKAASTSGVAGYTSKPSNSGHAATSIPGAEPQEDQDEVSSVVVSPLGGKTSMTLGEPASSENTAQAAASVKPAGHSPHFAQPTASFARRSGEIFRKETNISPTRTARETPPKSIKTSERHPSTGKLPAQRHQKRKSLPGGWLGENGQLSERSTAFRGLDANDSPGLSEHDTTSTAAEVTSKRNHRTMASKASMAAKTTAATDTNQAPQLRKKASSYMAPTTATTQRTAGTARKEIPKRYPSPKKSLQKGLAIDTTLAAQSSVPRSPETAAAFSDTSSVQFILDRPNISNQFAHASSKGVSGEATLSTESVLQRPQSESTQAKIGGDGRLGGPTKVPRAYRRSDSTAETVVSSPEEMDLYTNLPGVPNTTTVRRTSNSQILKPILNRLSAQGLARERTSSIQSLASATDSVSNALNMARQQAPSAKESDSRPEIASKSRASGPMPGTFPPHLRKRGETGAVSKAAEDGAMPSLTGNAFVPPREKVALVGSSVPFVMPILKSSPSSSLRATASEFTPMPSFSEPSEPHNEHNFGDLTAYRSNAEWSSMSPETKRAITRLRELNVGVRGSLTLPSRSQAIPEWSNPDWAPFERDTYQPLSTMGPVTTVDDNGSPHMVQPNQVLKPCLSPGKKTVHWTLQDADGNDTPAKFGRAPAPSTLPGLESPVPVISPASDDTSPLITPHTGSRGWSIGSAASPNRFAWKGGDGKEIRFMGYGPYAERDPNSAVSFDFHGRSSSLSKTLGHPEDKENFVTVAPRSQKQWAEKMGYPKVPCGNVVITQAVESIPFGSELAGYCHDCYADH